jgi:hypothetical protein
MRLEGLVKFKRYSYLNGSRNRDLSVVASETNYISLRLDYFIYIYIYIRVYIYIYI